MGMNPFSAVDSGKADSRRRELSLAASTSKKACAHNIVVVVNCGFFECIFLFVHVEVSELKRGLMSDKSGWVCQ
jgi:hypothetical protein